MQPGKKNKKKRPFFVLAEQIKEGKKRRSGEGGERKAAKERRGSGASIRPRNILVYLVSKQQEAQQVSVGRKITSLE